MSTKRTVVTGGHVVTMDPSQGELPNGAVLIEDGAITAVAADAEQFAGVDAEIVDATGGIVLPGMVDSHRHTWMALLRAISADQSLLQFLGNTFYGIGSLLSAEDMAAATEVGSLEALDSGITTFLDCCDCVNSPEHARASVAALRSSGARTVYAYGMQAFDYKPAAFASHAERLRDARALRSSEFTSDDPMNAMAMLLSDFGTLPFSDTAAEIRLSTELDILVASHTGAATTSILLRGLRELHDHQLLRPGHLHIHCPALSTPEWRLLADTGAKVSIAPETELQMGMGFPPFRAAIEHGILPGISTDTVACGSGDLFAQMRLGLQTQRALDNDRVHRTGTMPGTVELSVHDALTWATRGSAEAMGLGDRIGSLTVGKRADVIVVKPRWNVVPPSHMAGTVVLQSSAADVDTVIVDGEMRKRDGRLVGVDLAGVRSRATAALERLRTKAAALPTHDANACLGWFAHAERMATANFGAAYPVER
ncbi:amidohydrolase family protein [Streptomyces sp. SID3343]|uniref:amidohydrolase family protein n=1 Tax=Streptomyces sp. SID3343 TaxID=2690260 RepID=UPI001370461B|nr:amidohydrolase family protein [Streptomyces sp. SID3343]MYW05562.1 amidohydrolase family protein [Streptomyces sp. SID3343]